MLAEQLKRPNANYNNLAVKSTSIWRHPTWLINSMSALQKEDNPGLKPSKITDWLLRHVTLTFALSSVVIIAGIAVTLFHASSLSFAHSHMAFYSPSGVNSSSNAVYWDPVAPDSDKLVGDIYRAAPFIYGTLITSIIALLLGGANRYWRRNIPLRNSSGMAEHAGLIRYRAARCRTEYCIRVLGPLFSCSPSANAG